MRLYSLACFTRLIRFYLFCSDTSDFRFWFSTYSALYMLQLPLFWIITYILRAYTCLLSDIEFKFTFISIFIQYWWIFVYDWFLVNFPRFPSYFVYQSEESIAGSLDWVSRYVFSVQVEHFQVLFCFHGLGVFWQHLILAHHVDRTGFLCVA